jgi:predicted lipoprotein with Yx(FWY)xxD motif
MSRTKSFLTVAAAVTSLGLLGACGSVAADNAGSVAPVAVQRQAPTPAVQAKLVATQVGNLGQVLTDGKGMTLYRFDKDAAKPPKSNCDNACADAWPPVLSNSPAEVQGVDQALVGTVARTDGKMQVTVNNWPVYTYAKDTAPGMALGQGVGGTWAAVTAAGGKAAEKTAAVNSTEIDGLGTVLADQNGKTLYLFTKDKKNSKKSVCYDACAKTWPAMVTKGETTVSGVDQKLIGKFQRDDGTWQVTIGGWPAYTYAKDTAPGQATGHGVGGTWFEFETNGCKVADGKAPTGVAAAAAAAPASSDAPAPAATDNSGGYSNGTGGY